MNTYIEGIKYAKTQAKRDKMSKSLNRKYLRNIFPDTRLSVCHHGLKIQGVTTPPRRMGREGGCHNQRNTGSLMPREVTALGC